ncbi:MAG: DsbA family oxidoreductase [Rhodocyclaceae bacterium]|nr:DsbA family oxidoreductase [Rhodocyclaceae bacterium]
MLTIEIVSDVVCPWCFIGKRRLETALAMVRRDIPDFACQTIWRPFFLNPDTPPAGEPYLPFLVNKFGSREKVEELFDRVREAGRAYGIDYAFEKIALRANTLKAHRLLHWAQAKGNADALIERLFAAQFQRGEAVGDPETLVKIATECGYDAKEVAAYLASDRDADIVRQRESEARQLGITMIPTFILAGKQIIVGAEDPAILAEGIRRSI